MQPWWPSVANLGRDAVVWLLGLATFGGTQRDKPPTLGAGKTTNVRVEVGKARRFATKHEIEFDADAGYKTLRRASVVGPGGKTGAILTQAKGGGHMQLSTPVGIGVFHTLCAHEEFRDYLMAEVGIGESEPDPFFEEHEEAPIQMAARRLDDGEGLVVEATFSCPRCRSTVTHEYGMTPGVDEFLYVAVACEQCSLGLRHFRAFPFRNPEVTD